MELYVKNSKRGPIIRTLVCGISCHPSKWGLSVVGGREPVGLGLAENYDTFFQVTFFCWTFEIVQETFVDEDGLVGNDRSVV